MTAIIEVDNFKQEPLRRKDKREKLSKLALVLLNALFLFIVKLFMSDHTVYKRQIHCHKEVVE